MRGAIYIVGAFFLGIIILRIRNERKQADKEEERDDEETNED